MILFTCRKKHKTNHFIVLITNYKLFTICRANLQYNKLRWDYQQSAIIMKYNGHGTRIELSGVRVHSSVTIMPAHCCSLQWGLSSLAGGGG